MPEENKDQEPKISLIYRFRTFQELMENVPTDRIMDCMRELSIAITEIKAMNNLLTEVASELAKEKGIELPPTTVKLPEEWEWVDDGKGVLEPVFHIGPEEQLRMKIQLQPEQPNDTTTTQHGKTKK